MQLTVQGKQIAIGDSLKNYVTEKLNDLNAKFFNRGVEAIVTFSREGHAFYKTHISLHIGKGIMVQATATETDPYVSFDITASKIAKQMRRYKNRLRDHHDKLDTQTVATVIQARDFVLKEEEAAAEEETTEAANDPIIIAEMTTDIQTMSVSDAVMRLDLAGQTALLFRNAKTHGLNMVYKRSDGNIGWVDPAIQLPAQSLAAQ